MLAMEAKKSLDFCSVPTMGLSETETRASDIAASSNGVYPEPRADYRFFPLTDGDVTGAEGETEPGGAFFSASTLAMVGLRRSTMQPSTEVLGACSLVSEGAKN